MEVVVEDVRFLNRALGDTIPTDYPLDNLGDVVDVEIDIRYDGDYVLATSLIVDDGNTTLIKNPDPASSGLIQDLRRLWTDNVIAFQNFEEGDEVTLTIGAVTEVKIILEKESDQSLLMDSVFVSGGIAQVGSIAFISTKIESIEYFHGLIENSEPINFVSKTDGSTQRARVEGLDNTDTSTNHAMQQLGAKSYQYDNNNGLHAGLVVVGNGIGDGAPTPVVSQAFTLKHTILIQPLSTAINVDDDKNGIAPPWLFDSNSLKHVFKIETSKDLTNPNKKKTVVEFETLGNTGFTGENFNTKIRYYSVSNVTYTRADLTTIEALELTTDVITLEFDLINTVNSPFSSGNTLMVFNHWYLHESEEEYRLPDFPDPNQSYPSKDRVMKDNQLFDRIECVLDSVAVTPDNLGTNISIIQDCEPTYVSNSKAHVKVKIKLHDNVLSRAVSAPNKDYKLSMSVKNHTLSRAKSDAETVVIDINKYFTEVTDPNMIQITNTFLDLTNEDVDTGSESLLVRTEDAVLGVASFTLDRNDIPNYNRSDADINFLSASAKMIAKKNTGEFFELDKYETNFFDLEIIDEAPFGTVPFMDITEDRGFTTPADDLRKNVVVHRRDDLNTPFSGVYNFELLYPFIVRSEAWEPLINASNEFLVASQQNNGKNHDWVHYFIGTDWDLYMRIEIVASKNGLPLAPYIKDSVLLTEDYDDGLEWDTFTATTSLTSNGDPIGSVGNFGVSFVENTLVELQANYTAFDPPTLPDLEFVMMIAVFEKTNYLGQFRIYTQYDTDLSNQWIGLAGILKATKTNPSGTLFKVSAELKPPSPEQTFKSSLRIYDKRDESGVPDGMLTEDSILMETENGIIMNVE